MTIDLTDYTVSRKTLLFADMMESTRLLDQHESEIVPRWRGLIAHIVETLLPPNRGAFVNSLGDGFLLAFETEREAVVTAFAIRDKCNADNETCPDYLKVYLRMGLEVGEFTIDRHDVYGRAAMMGARLMTLAGPGEIIISQSLKDMLVSDIDADIEDLGQCYIKHLEYPIRAFRIGPPGPEYSMFDIGDSSHVLPTIAVLPLRPRQSEDDEILGQILAEEVINKLCVSSYLNVISSLTSNSLASRALSAEEIGRKLKASYVLSGSFHNRDDTLHINLELSEAEGNNVVWTASFSDHLASILISDSDLIASIAHNVCKYLLLRELEEVESRPWPNLESYKLLLAAIARLHCNSRQKFEEAFKLLELVASRATRQYLPYAWMGKWYVLRTQQGWTDDPQRDGELALNCTKRALDYNPNSSLALTIDGFVHTNLLRQLDRASERYEQAVAANPNDSLALLAKGTLHAFQGDGRQAVADTTRARKLSPFDPMGYFYDSLSGTAMLAAGRYEDAVALADRSLKANRTHTSTLRLKAVAHWNLGQEIEARKAINALLELEPEFTVSGFQAKSPAADFKPGKAWVRALLNAGAPE